MDTKFSWNLSRFSCKDAICCAGAAYLFTGRELTIRIMRKFANAYYANGHNELGIPHNNISRSEYNTLIEASHSLLTHDIDSLKNYFNDNISLILYILSSVLSREVFYQTLLFPPLEDYIKEKVEQARIQKQKEEELLKIEEKKRKQREEESKKKAILCKIKRRKFIERNKILIAAGIIALAIIISGTLVSYMISSNLNKESWRYYRR